MSFPTVATTSSGADTGTDQNQVVTLPASIAAGDLLIFVIGVDGSSGTYNIPSGWTQLWIDESNVHHSLAGYRIADGTEGASVTVTGSTNEQSAWQAYRITGWHGTTPPEAATPVTGGANPDPPNLTASWGAEDNLWLAVATNDGNLSVSAAPTNYTNLLTQASGSSGCGSARRELNAASENPGAFTGAAEDYMVGTIVIRPAAAAGGGSPILQPLAMRPQHQAIMAM